MARGPTTPDPTGSPTQSLGAAAWNDDITRESRTVADGCHCRGSPRRLARIAGVLYLVNIVGGAFAIGYVNSRLLATDPATTAQHIQAHELLYRSGLAATSWSP